MMEGIKGIIEGWLYMTSMESIVDILAEIAENRARETAQNRTGYGGIYG